MEIKKSSKVPQKYSCEKCYYNTCYSKDYKKHLLTKKHMEMNGINQELSKILICLSCEKEFKSQSGLWKHKQKCNQLETLNQTNNKKEITNDEPTDKLLILKILEQNSELMKENIELRKGQTDIKEMILEIVKNGITNTTNNTTTHTNSHNKAFNLNFFLNETCKNAMNITDFVDSIKLQLSDLENIGEIGYVKGISNIITSNLQALDVTQRPIHCTDKKREILYIKDENKWEKEDERKNKLRKVIKKIANKNISLIQEFKKKYPDCIKSTSRFSDKYNKIIIEAMGGSGDNDEEKEDKIIKNISDITTLNKNEGIKNEEI